MEITQEKINKLYTLYDELETAKRKSSEAIKAAKDNSDSTIQVTRKGGTTQEVTEKALWDEVYHLGENCEAAAALQGKYPHVFELSKAVADKLQEIRTFSLAELELDATEIKLSDIMKLTQAIVRHELQNTRN